MSLSENLFLNTNGADGFTYWQDVVNVSATTFEGVQCFQLASSGKMTQSAETVVMLTVARTYLLSFSYGFATKPSNSINTAASIDVVFIYNSGVKERCRVPLTTINKNPSPPSSQGVWYVVSTLYTTRENDIITQVCITISTSAVASSLLILGVAAQRILTDVEDHNDLTSPHKLPLNITVGPEGIKGMKGSVVSFWLDDEGNATFKGHLEALSGSFGGVEGKKLTINEAGEVVIPGIVTFDSLTGDVSGKINNTAQTVNNWAFSGKTTINGGAIETDTISAIAIKTEELVVGDNITLGTGARITWAQVTDENGNPATALTVGARPSSWMPSAEDVGARSDSWMPTAAEVQARADSWTPTPEEIGAITNFDLITTLGEDYIVTGKIYANQVAAGLLAGCTIRTIPIASGGNCVQLQQQWIDFFYNSSSKMQIGFINDDNMSDAYPCIAVGQGDGSGRNKFYIYKDAYTCWLYMIASNGTELGIGFNDSSDSGGARISFIGPVDFTQASGGIPAILS